MWALGERGRERAERGFLMTIRDEEQEETEWTQHSLIEKRSKGGKRYLEALLTSKSV